MNRKILFILLLLLIPVGLAEPSVTSYNGYVNVNGIPASNALVKVLNSVCGEVASSTSIDGGLYQITVPWEDASFNQAGVKAGETITFLVNGKFATSNVIGTKGSNIGMSLTILSSAATYACKTDDSYDRGNGGGGGGGGGGSASAELFENIVKKESREESLSKDAPRTYSFSTPELSVSQIVITSNISAGPINVQIELLKNRSILVSDDAPGNVYKYLNIWVGSLGFAVPKNIKEGVVKFKIENSWITSNGFTDSDIKMLKWNGIEWITLVTEKKNSNDKFTFYEAKTTSFSPFAISSVKGEALVTAAPVGAETTATVASQETEKTKSTPGFGDAIAIAAFCAVLMLRRKKGL